jgi:glutathione S-transferase
VSEASALPYPARSRPASNRYTIADVATYPWMTLLPNLGFDWTEYPGLRAWRDL